MGVKYVRYCDLCGNEGKKLSTSFSFNDKRFEKNSVSSKFILTIRHGYQDKMNVTEPCICKECFLNLLEIAVEQAKECLEKKSNGNN